MKRSRAASLALTGENGCSDHNDRNRRRSRAADCNLQQLTARKFTGVTFGRRCLRDLPTWLDMAEEPLIGTSQIRLVTLSCFEQGLYIPVEVDNALIDESHPMLHRKRPPKGKTATEHCGEKCKCLHLTLFPIFLGPSRGRCAERPVARPPLGTRASAPNVTIQTCLVLTEILFAQAYFV